MSDYKGFINSDTYADLLNLLRKIADIRGLENKLHHLYQPDTDMDDKVCEDFTYSKFSILKELEETGVLFKLLAKKIVELTEV